MMEKMGWTDRVKEYFKEERNIPQTVKRKKANWIGHRLCTKTRTGRKDRRDGRMRKKTYVATGRP